MKSSDLNAMLYDTISTAIFVENICYEIEQYIKQLRKEGSAVPMYFNEDVEIILSKSLLTKMLNETLSGGLSKLHLAYISDCLTLGERVSFENEFIREIIFEIADQEIHGQFPVKGEIISYLNRIS